jgi:hypothetical protein
MAGNGNRNSTRGVGGAGKGDIVSCKALREIKVASQFNVGVGYQLRSP